MKLVKIHFVSILHFYEICLDQTKGDMTSTKTIKKNEYISRCQMEIHLQVHQDKMKDPSSWEGILIFQIFLFEASELPILLNTVKKGVFLYCGEIIPKVVNGSQEPRQST